MAFDILKSEKNMNKMILMVCFVQVSNLKKKTDMNKISLMVHFVSFKIGEMDVKYK